MKKHCSKIVSFILSLVMIFSFTAPAFAIGNESDNLLRAVEATAYLDINTASPEEQEKILAARNIIAYTKEWVADGNIGWVEDITTGEIIRYLPSYSEVFPGWDLPVDCTSAQTSAYIPVMSSIQKTTQATGWQYFDSWSTYLEEANSEKIADPFVFIINKDAVQYSRIRSYAESLTSSKTCNIGFTDMNTMEPLGYAMDLTLKEAISCSSFGHECIGIRASTFSTPGWASMAVEGMPR